MTLASLQLEVRKEYTSHIHPKNGNVTVHILPPNLAPRLFSRFHQVGCSNYCFPHLR